MRMRSMLFVPADSERKLARGVDSVADALILDLEDGVAAQNKASARTAARALLHTRAGGTRTAAQLWVRINALGSEEARLDLAAIVPAAPDGLMVPRVAHPRELIELGRVLTALETEAGRPAGATRLIPLLETPRGCLSAPDYLHGSMERLRAIAWGAEDLAAALGLPGTRGSDGDWSFALLGARTQCLMVARALELDAIEAVTTQLKDRQSLRHDCERACAAGFTGKLAIHPDQLELINAAFTPSAAALERARRIVAAFDSRPGTGAVALDDEMVDQVHLRAARRLLGQ
jgi:citrate lyase subunit beta / citryl-CoA lyase